MAKYIGLECADLAVQRALKWDSEEFLIMGVKSSQSIIGREYLARARVMANEIGCSRFCILPQNPKTTSENSGKIEVVPEAYIFRGDKEKDVFELKNTLEHKFGELRNNLRKYAASRPAEYEDEIKKLTRFWKLIGQPTPLKANTIELFRSQLENPAIVYEIMLRTNGFI